MKGFPRNIKAAQGRDYDVIVIGAGIYGMTLTLEAARRGLRALLVEKDDFGGATSLNSLRILHGGLRYLQHLEMKRVLESTQQRGWFMKTFAPLCRTLPCLMPLYGEGLKRPSVFRAALAMNNAIAPGFPKGKVLGTEETMRRFPRVKREGLLGAALWYDGQVLSPQRLHAEALRWASSLGAVALNYVEPIGLISRGDSVQGLETTAGRFGAPVVINAAGPWSREVAALLDSDRPELMTPSLTFNVVLNVPPPSEAAVAVQGSRMYFITPHRAGVTFAGTVHRAWEGVREPTQRMLSEFVNDLNGAIPGWNLTEANVVRVTPGVLPCKGPGESEMAHRSTFVTHSRRGLYSVCGVKYTTAQRFAETTLNRIFPSLGPVRDEKRMPEIGSRSVLVEPAAVMELNDDALLALFEEEAVTCAEDFLERRMDWIIDEDQRAGFRARVENMLPATAKAAV